MNKEYIDKHEAYLLLKHKAETYMLPATKEAYEKFIGIFGTLCDYMVDNCRCDVFCPYADTKDESGECEAWRTIQKIRQEV